MGFSIEVAVSEDTSPERNLNILDREAQAP